MLRTASVAQKPFVKEGFLRHLPMFLSNLTDFRSLPAIAEKPFRDTFRQISQPRCKEKAVFYAGCLIDFAYPETGEAVVRILNRAGIEVAFPEKQTCCGAPARYSGAFDVAGQNAADNIDALLEPDAGYIVSACPTCTVALRHEFISTLESLGRGELIPKATQVASRAIDFSTLVTKLVAQKRLTFREGAQLGKFTYHDSCHLKRTLNVSAAPRELLKQAGGDLAEMSEADMCCGMGGSYSLKLPEISAPMLQRKLENIRATGAPLAATDCPGCVMQIRGGFDRDGSVTRVQHTAEVLERALE
jgi:Fe-S oxidoreductase